MKVSFVPIESLFREEIKIPWAKLFVWGVLVLLSFLLFFTARISKTESYQVNVSSKNQVELLVPIKEIPFILEKERLFVRGKEYSYTVEKIEKEMIPLGSIYGKKVLLTIKKLPKRLQKEENTFQITIEKEQSSVFKMLWNGWKEEEYATDE